MNIVSARFDLSPYLPPPLSPSFFSSSSLLSPHQLSCLVLFGDKQCFLVSLFNVGFMELFKYL